MGASLVALPVRSAWANGITNSIVASGHGSDWAIGCTLSLLTLEEWANEIDINDADTTFVSVFGERGYNSKVHQGIRYNNDGSVKKISADRTLSEILQLRKPNKSAGKATWLQTLCSTVLDANAREIWVSDGPAFEQPYERFGFDA